MPERVKFEDMLGSLRRSLEAIPEHRTGRNTRYSLVDGGLGAFAVSPDGTRLAFGRDRTGDERFELVIRDLDTGAEEIVTDQMLGDLAWAADSASLLWVEASAEWRPVRVFHHRLGTPARRGPAAVPRGGPGVAGRRRPDTGPALAADRKRLV